MRRSRLGAGVFAPILVFLWIVALLVVVSGLVHPEARSQDWTVAVVVLFAGSYLLAWWLVRIVRSRDVT
jgi:uncharacterized membrane protein